MDLEGRLRRNMAGEVLFDLYDRGCYATDASIYQIMPKGVVVPETIADVEAALAVCIDAGVPVVPRGGGTSQCGQTINDALVIDLSKHINKPLEVDTAAATVWVEPGLVLDELNRHLKPLGLWFPVDVSTASRATLGGICANNSCGSRSIRYGTARDNTVAIDAILADGSKRRFEETIAGNGDPLAQDLLALGAREALEIEARLPKVPRRVGGYNVDALLPKDGVNNLAHLLVGSEGTLAFFEKIQLKLSSLPVNKVLGVCHFPTFYAAMDAAQHLVALGPSAIELFDDTLLALARENPLFRPVISSFVRGAPKALLIVEFAELDQAENLKRLGALHEIMAELGFAFGDSGKHEGGVVEAIDPVLQRRIIEVRKQGLNIMMSMKSAGKPVSFIEDCCVELKDLAEYTDKLTSIFRKYGTEGTFYAHASVGTLHVRPVLNLKLDQDVRSMRAIAEETFNLVRQYQGSHSGEHGDGIVRSEFHTSMFGPRIVGAFNDIKARLDPKGLFNPNRIVDPPRMDDRTLFRYGTGYQVQEFESVFAWDGHVGAGRGLQGAVEMCNNNGACRKLTGDVMCPSYRVTRDERHSVRGRANTLRLGISGQLGSDALASDEMAQSMALCVSCKACRRECPTGVDMAKMKIEVQAVRNAEHGLSLRDRAIAYLPRYAPFVAPMAGIANAMGRLGAGMLGFSPDRPLPQWRADRFSNMSGQDEGDVLLFADCFNRYFEPGNLRAVETVLASAGTRVNYTKPRAESRPLCCGRTYLSVGLIDQARVEMRRCIEAIKPALKQGKPVVGLEPSCLLTFRDEAPALLGDEWSFELGQKVMLFEEYIGKLDSRFPLKALNNKIIVHAHCHQKSFNLMGTVTAALKRIPDTIVETIPSSCCGMAGAFGYQAETAQTSKAMAELSLLPKIRAAGDAVIAAPGTSCRHQIALGTGRTAKHPAAILAELLS